MTALSGRADLRITRNDDRTDLALSGDRALSGRQPLDIREVQQALIDGEPSIHLDPLRDRSDQHPLADDQIDIIRLNEELDALTQRQIN